MRIIPPLMKIIRDNHIVTDVERAITLDNTIPMMIIDVDHYMIVMAKGHIVHLVIGTR